MDLLTPVVLAQPTTPPIGPGVAEELLGSWISAVGTFLGTLVVGGLLLVLVPEFVEKSIDTIEEEPGKSFVWGLGIGILLVIVLLGLIITLVGIVIAIPLMFVMAIVWFVGSAIAFILLGERLVGAADMETTRWGHLLVGALLATVIAAVPFIGGFINFVINVFGVGAIVFRWRSGYVKAEEEAA